jgi:hypothetical protein
MTAAHGGFGGGKKAEIRRIASASPQKSGKRRLCLPAAVTSLRKRAPHTSESEHGKPENCRSADGLRGNRVVADSGAPPSSAVLAWPGSIRRPATKSHREPALATAVPDAMLLQPENSTRVRGSWSTLRHAPGRLPGPRRRGCRTASAGRSRFLSNRKLAPVVPLALLQESKQLVREAGLPHRVSASKRLAGERKKGR